tara:strand:- start:344 stop:568 length:225 start_codon:yes stop_codon:yes gene_type:complete
VEILEEYSQFQSIEIERKYLLDLHHHLNHLVVLLMEYLKVYFLILHPHHLRMKLLKKQKHLQVYLLARKVIRCR